MFGSSLSRAAAVGVAVAACAPAGAQMVTYGFHELPAGTRVTTQYYGVTFSVVGQSCLPQFTLYMRTASGEYLPPSGNFFSDPVLVIDQGCPDFSSDYLRMVFDQPTKEVSFTLGPWAGNYDVRAYNSSGTLVSTQHITISGVGFQDVNRLVTFKAASPLFKRVEVEETIGLFEAIDDLTFMLDETPPDVAIDAPTTMECFCGGTVFGSVIEPDSPVQWKLDYAMDPGGPWTRIATGSSAIPGGALGSWDTSGRPEGYHYIRLFAENGVGLTSTTTVVVWVSSDFDVVDARIPTVVGRGAHPWGTIQDNFCTESYEIKFRPAAGGSYEPINGGPASYPGPKVNQTFAVWDTNAVPDGPYSLIFTGENSCGDGGGVLRETIVDNTPPDAEMTRPAQCQFLLPGIHPIVGTAADANLASWSLEFTGGPFHEWVLIERDTRPRFNDLLAEWDTRNLPPCDYTLRLIVTDEAVLDGNEAIHNRSHFTVSVRVGCPADFDLNLVQDVFDLLAFLEYWFADCP